MTFRFPPISAEPLAGCATAPEIIADAPPILIGLFSPLAPHHSANPARLRAVAAEAALQGGRFGIFGAADIDFTAGVARYWGLGSEGWTRWRGPLPDAVILGDPPRCPADMACAMRLRDIRAFVTGFLPSKRAVSKALLQTEVAPHIIPFRSIGGPADAPAAASPVAPDSDAMAREIAAFLDIHPRAVLKPSKGGRRGRDVLFLAREGRDIVLRELNQQRRLPAEQALAELVRRIGTDRWMIQKFVVSRSRDGRVFDIRVHVHKDGAGQWQVVRAYVRLAEAGLLVSNTSRGGYQGDLDYFVAGLGEQGRVLADRIRRLGIETGEAIDSRFGGHNDELGVDVLIDSQRWPWIVEVNSGPQSRHHEFERARYAVAYAMDAGRRWRSGLWTRPTPSRRPPLNTGEESTATPNRPAISQSTPDCGAKESP